MPVIKRDLLSIGSTRWKFGNRYCIHFSLFFRKPPPSQRLKPTHVRVSEALCRRGLGVAEPVLAWGLRGLCSLAWRFKRETPHFRTRSGCRQVSLPCSYGTGEPTFLLPVVWSLTPGATGCHSPWRPPTALLLHGHFSYQTRVKAFGLTRSDSLRIISLLANSESTNWGH